MEFSGNNGGNNGGDNGGKTASTHPALPTETRRGLARLVLFVFVLTFIASRLMVLLVMLEVVPDFFLHVGGTHVHHLNYGIFLMSGVGAYLIFARPAGRRLRLAAMLYAVSLALTFDEFGMWLHLGGSYWQRASYDGIAVIAAIFGFIAFFPSRKSLQRWAWWQIAIVTVAAALFFAVLAKSLTHLHIDLTPRLERIEEQGPR